MNYLKVSDYSQKDDNAPGPPIQFGDRLCSLQRKINVRSWETYKSVPLAECLDPSQVLMQNM